MFVGPAILLLVVFPLVIFPPIVALVPASHVSLWCTSYFVRLRSSDLLLQSCLSWWQELG